MWKLRVQIMAVLIILIIDILIINELKGTDPNASKLSPKLFITMYFYKLESECHS